MFEPCVQAQCSSPLFKPSVRSMCILDAQRAFVYFVSSKSYERAIRKRFTAFTSAADYAMALLCEVYAFESVFVSRRNETFMSGRDVFERALEPNTSSHTSSLRKAFRSISCARSNMRRVSISRQQHTNIFIRKSLREVFKFEPRTALNRTEQE